MEAELLVPSPSQLTALKRHYHRTESSTAATVKTVVKKSSGILRGKLHYLQNENKTFLLKKDCCLRVEDVSDDTIPPCERVVIMKSRQAAILPLSAT